MKEIIIVVDLNQIGHQSNYISIYQQTKQEMLEEDTTSGDGNSLLDGRGGQNHAKIKGGQVNLLNPSVMIDESEEFRDLDSDIKRRKYIKYGLIGGIVLIVVILAIVLPIALSGGGNEPFVPPKPPLLPDATNDYFVDSASVSNSSFSESGQIFVKKPVAMRSAANSQENPEDFTPKIGLDWSETIKFGPNNQQPSVLNYTFDMVDFKTARLTLVDANAPRFSIPESSVNKPDSNKNMRLDMVGFQRDIGWKRPFAFTFSDVADPTNIFFDTRGQNLVFADKYIQIDIKLPSQRLYGLGERTQSTFRLGEGAWGMWANGNGNGETDDGLGRGGESGVHPFLLVQTKKPQEYVGLFFRNANAQVPIIRFNDDGSSTLSYIALGGQLEVYFLIHGTAKQVIQDYHNLIGKPQLPPFWALGWQEASVSMKALDPINFILESYKSSRFPLEAVYLTQDLSNKTQNFGYNQNLLPLLNDLLIELRVNGQKLIANIESSIYAPAHVDAAITENIYYSKGNLSNAFIKSSQNTAGSYNGNLLGMKGESTLCVFMDWFNQDGSTQTFWTQAISDLYSQQNVRFDGVWMTDNEPFQSIQGEKKLESQQQTQERMLLLAESSDQSYYNNKWYKSFNEQQNSTFYLPFTPQFDVSGPYDSNSLSLNATHASSGYREYDVHNLYGHSMVQATAAAVKNLTDFKDKRQFILTKSTFASSGRYASYAVQSKYRNWESLRSSINHVINMNMFGLTHTGSDACGSNDQDPTATAMDEELCLRWLQLTTFMPLARHSQTYSNKLGYQTFPQGFTTNTTKAAALATMHDRMQYLRLMYTCLFEASQFGGTCIDPLFFHFPLNVVYADLQGANDTFIVAGAIKVSPVVGPQGTNTTFESHFPKGKWVNLADFTEVFEGNNEFQSLKYRSTVNAHLLPGAIIPFQNNSDQQARTTTDLKRSPLSLIVNRNDEGAAQGTILLDGGILISEIENKTYEYYTILHKANSVQFQLTQGTRGAQDQGFTLSEVMIADAADLEDTDFACAFFQDGQIQDLQATYDSSKLALRLTTKSFGDKLKFSKISNIFYGSSTSGNLNLCRSVSYEYVIPEEFDLTKVLSSSNGTIPLMHKGGVLPNLTLSLRMFDEGIINVKWTWEQQPAPAGHRIHFEVPDDIVNTSRPTYKSDALGRHITIQRNPFQLNFTQQTGQTEPFLQIKNLIYDSFLNWVGLQAFTQTGDDFRGILGLGERSQKDLFYKDGIYSMWATDEPTKAEDGTPPGKQSYGAHPFFMYQHNPNHWVGVFFKQAHAQDWIVKNQPSEGIVQLKQIATGGVTDIYVMFRAQTPDSVVGFYQTIVGKPVLQPQWALGWHQCKYCYRTQDDYRSVVDNYRKYGIPLDTQWADIDYMDRYRDFTVDPINFGNLTAYVDDLFHNMKVKFVPIIDAGIAMRPGYDAYDKGLVQNVFLKMAGQNEPFKGRVWPNEAVFPDFFNPNTSKWWGDQLTTFKEKLVWFDGLWLDMNEAANFCNGACHDRQKSAKSLNDKLIYTPTGRDLEYKSLPVDIMHSNGMSQLDTHSYYGTQQTKATYDWFIKGNAKRPFIVERSSFAGLGKYGSKWLGDSSSTFDDMQRSVTGSMMMNIFGIPFVGGDICGFGGPNTTPELCARWHQVGAFQPFSRNHRDCDGAPQEPYRFIDVTVGTHTVTDIMRDAILTKYSLIRYYYTHFFLLSTDVQTTGTFYKPAFFEFPNDPLAYAANHSENVMLGPSIKLSIKTSPSADWTSDTNAYYFPTGTWCDILDPTSQSIYSNKDKTGQVISLPSNLTQYQLHLREGHIIVHQNASAIKPVTSEDMKDHKVDLIINPRNMTVSNRTTIFQASGVYVNDDGVSPASKLDQGYNHYTFSFQYRNSISKDSTNDENIKLYVALKAEATRYYSNETKCSGINQNDYLGNIYIEDPVGLFQSAKYFVDLIRPDQTYEQIGLATLDQTTNRLFISSFNLDAPSVCLGYIQEIRFRPSVTSQQQLL